MLLTKTIENSTSKHNRLFIGLDAHKAFTEAAYIEDQRDVDPVHYGRISSAKATMTKLVRQFESQYPKATLYFVYEEGSCSYRVYRLKFLIGCTGLLNHYHAVIVREQFRTR